MGRGSWLCPWVFDWILQALKTFLVALFERARMMMITDIPARSLRALSSMHADAPNGAAGASRRHV